MVFARHLRATMDEIAGMEAEDIAARYIEDIIVVDIINEIFSQKYNSLAGGTPASPGIVTLIPSATIR